MRVRTTELVVDRHAAATPDGWQLELKRTYDPSLLRERGRPVLIIPGYGMNSFIFGFHPRGTSMERCLAEAGFEVWSANLRAQGATRRHRPGAPGPSLRAYAEQDLTALTAAVLGATHTAADSVDLIGCSLGGSIAYAHLALVPDARVHALITIGAPLRMVGIHPLLKRAFASPWLAGKLVVRGTRRMIRAGAPLLTRFPSALSIYMNAAHVDLSVIDQMIDTVEDPHPRINKDIAHWINAGDLVLRGVDVTKRLGRIDLPLLVVVSNRDGIVPEAANLSVTDAWGGRDVEVLRVGDEREWYAHADLFIGDEAPRVVFGPMAEWLRKRSGE